MVLLAVVFATHNIFFTWENVFPVHRHTLIVPHVILTEIIGAMLVHLDMLLHLENVMLL